MIWCYLLSSSLVPVLSTWLMKKGHSGEEQEGLLGKARSFYSSYLKRALQFRWLIAGGYLLAAGVFLYFLLPRVGTEIFPDVYAPEFQIRLRAPVGTRIERTELVALKALDVMKNEIGPDNISITSGFIGVQPANYPINTIYLWTSGPQEAVLLVALKPSVTNNEKLHERLRAKLHEAMPDVQVSFEAGDNLEQGVGFRCSPPPRGSLPGGKVGAGHPYAGKARVGGAEPSVLRSLHS